MDEYNGYFIPLSKTLQKNGFCVYRFNFEQTTISDEIKQLENVVQKVRNNHKKLFIVGQSTGGLVAAFQKEPVDYTILTFPVVNAKKTFERLSYDHEVTQEWMEDAEKYDLTGKHVQDFMFYSDEDEYILLSEYERVECEKKLLEGWGHGPSNEKQFKQLFEEIIFVLSRQS